MKSLLYVFSFFCVAFFGPVRVANAQPEGFPEAEKAMLKILEEKGFGDYAFDRKEIVTLAKNDRVRGLNGLMFAYYRKGKSDKILLSVQWFDKKEDLLAFYQKQPPLKQGFRKMKVAGTTVWAINNNAYQWTDREHFMVSLGGKTVPDEMLKAYLKNIPSKVVEDKRKADE